MKLTKKRVIIIAAALGMAGLVAWLILPRPELPPGFARSNGRLEATEIYVATKYPGRVSQVLFNEGASVQAGQVLARMDTSTLEARLREAMANLREATQQRAVARAEIDVKQAQYTYTARQYARSRELVGHGAVSQQEAEIDSARMLAARAELEAARVKETQAVSSIDAARAASERTQAELRDTILVAPVRSRIETRLAEPGEVLPAGGRVYSLVDLSDVYMYVFLPGTVTGKLRLGSEARIVLDAAPQYPIPAYVSFVSPMAQFTPKTVETEEERHNLTFRVKLQIDRNRLLQAQAFVRTGVPGVGYVRFDETKEWPANLRVRPFSRRELPPPSGAVNPESERRSSPPRSSSSSSMAPMSGSRSSANATSSAALDNGATASPGSAPPSDTARSAPASRAATSAGTTGSAELRETRGAR
jgi:HlyD family secretion protein